MSIFNKFVIPLIGVAGVAGIAGGVTYALQHKQIDKKIEQSYQNGLKESSNSVKFEERYNSLLEEKAELLQQIEDLTASHSADSETIASLQAQLEALEEQILLTEEELRDSIVSNLCTLTYIVDGEVYSTEITTKGSTVTVPANDPIKKGYDFMAWDDQNGVVCYDSFVVNDDLVITARFSRSADGGLYSANGNCLYTFNELIDNNYFRVFDNRLLRSSADITSLAGSLYIPDNLGITSIGGDNYTSSKGLFYNCSKLTHIDLPNSLTTIEGYAFYSCSGLVSVSIPDSVTTIGKSAFTGCSSLEEVIIPEGVSVIQNGTFTSCKAIKRFVLPSSLTSFDMLSFAGLTDCVVEYAGTLEDWMTNITFTVGGSSIGLVQYVKTFKCNGIDIKDVIVPNTITEIKAYTFAFLPIENLVITTEEIFIHKLAFTCCRNLKTVYLGDMPNISSDTGVTNSNFSPFYYANANCKIYCWFQEDDTVNISPYWNYGERASLTTYYGYTYEQYLQAINPVTEE